MLDVTSRLADEERNDVRIEAAIAKLYGSEMSWQVVDQLMQVCGGRGYETAQSLQARGLRSVVPITEQTMRDMRVNRIFEGSTEIMHLIIAREAMDQHLQGGRGSHGTRPQDRGQGEGARPGRCLLRHLVPPAGSRQRPRPRVIFRLRGAGRAYAVRRGHQP